MNESLHHAPYAKHPMPRLASAIQARAGRFLRAVGAFCGLAPRARTQPRQDALLLLHRREVLIAERRRLRRQHKARLTCSRELQRVTHELLRGRG
jgi:hypothetical protein